jgi:cytidylate kinase
MIAIAIDGPAGSGKSTIAKRLASMLNYLYIDTGAMYRSATYSVLRANLPLSDEKAIVDLVSGLTIELIGSPEEQRVYIDGTEVTREIRKDDVSSAVSEVSKYKEIRRIMVEKQQRIAKSHPVVMDGRDIGTQVLPKAEFKFFLIASLEERARRRKKDFDALEESLDLRQIMDSISKRDQEDENREISPLKQASDAILIDTTFKSVDDVLAEMLGIIDKNEKNNLLLDELLI